MVIRLGVSIRLPIRLLNATTGTPVTGAIASDFKTSAVTVVKADGTTSTFTLVLGTNLFEIDSVKAPGLYHVLVGGTALGVQGPTQLAVTPSASLFGASISSFLVDVYPTEIDALPTLQSSVNSMVGNVQDLRDAELGKWQIVTSGADANKLILYRPDGTTVLQKFALKDSQGTSTFVNPFSRTPTT